MKGTRCNERIFFKRADLRLLKRVMLLGSFLVTALIFSLKSSSDLETEINVSLAKNKTSSSLVTVDLNAGHKFPGKFNLIEEAAQFNGALRRPSKACSSGVFNGQSCVMNLSLTNFL